jgi:hypothetical protein
MHTSSVSRPTYWFRHNPSFCRTGDLHVQPVAEGLLQPGFSFRECGALDAPQYIPTGGIRVTSQLSLIDTTLYLTEVADECRERMAERAAQADVDPYEDAYWGEETIPVGEATESDFGELQALGHQHPAPALAGSIC